MPTVEPLAAEPLELDASPRWFSRFAALAAISVAVIFLFQEVALRVTPGPSSTDEWLAAPLPAIERLRATLMFALFFPSLLTYAAVTQRAKHDAARVGLVFATVGCVVELAYRAVEVHAVPGWADAYRQTEDPAVRAILRARIDAFQDITVALYSVIRGAAMLTSSCFAAALLRSPGLGRAVALLFAANAQRVALAYVKPWVPALEPILDWMFIVVLAPLYACIGFWLWSAGESAALRIEAKVVDEDVPAHGRAARFHDV
jgi:hypothetical protein